jgi:hypothetical protein
MGRLLREQHRLPDESEGQKILDQVADTEADARAKMLIYLLENKLV